MEEQILSWTGEQDAALKFHVENDPAPNQFWEANLNLFKDVLDLCRGHNETEPPMAFAVQLAILCRSVNAHALAWELALKGFHAQSLNLLRNPLEDIISYRYLEVYPAEHERFTEVDDDLKSTPLFNDMIQKLESKTGREKWAWAREWNKEHLKFSHIDKKNVAAMFAKVDRDYSFFVGPQKNAEMFRHCAKQACNELFRLTEAANDHQQLLGRQPWTGWGDYAEWFEGWSWETT
jgi:hypothetical protein